MEKINLFSDKRREENSYVFLRHLSRVFIIISILTILLFSMPSVSAADFVLTNIEEGTGNLNVVITGLMELEERELSEFYYKVSGIQPKDTGETCLSNVTTECTEYSNKEGYCGSDNCTCVDETCTDYEEYCKSYEDYDCNCETNTYEYNCKDQCISYGKTNCRSECSRYGTYNCDCRYETYNYNCGYKTYSYNCGMRSYQYNCHSESYTYNCRIEWRGWWIFAYPVYVCSTGYRTVCSTGYRYACDYGSRYSCSTGTRYTCNTCSGCVAYETVCDSYCIATRRVCDTYTEEVCDTCERCTATGLKEVDVACKACDYTVCEDKEIPWKSWFEYDFDYDIKIGDTIDSGTASDKLCLEIGKEYTSNFTAGEELAFNEGDHNITFAVTDNKAGKSKITTFFVDVFAYIGKIGFYPTTGSDDSESDTLSTTAKIAIATILTGAAAAIGSTIVIRKKMSLSGKLGKSLGTVSNSVNRLDTMFSKVVSQRTPNVKYLTDSEKNRVIAKGNVSRIISRTTAPEIIPTMNLGGAMFSGKFITSNGVSPGPQQWIKEQQARAQINLANMRTSASSSLKNLGLNSVQTATVLAGGTITVENPLRAQARETEAYMKQMQALGPIVTPSSSMAFGSGMFGGRLSSGSYEDQYKSKSLFDKIGGFFGGVKEALGIQGERDYSFAKEQQNRLMSGDLLGFMGHGLGRFVDTTAHVGKLLWDNLPTIALAAVTGLVIGVAIGAIAAVSAPVALVIGGVLLVAGIYTLATDYSYRLNKLNDVANGSYTAESKYDIYDKDIFDHTIVTGAHIGAGIAGGSVGYNIGYGGATRLIINNKLNTKVPLTTKELNFMKKDMLNQMKPLEGTDGYNKLKIKIQNSNDLTGKELYGLRSQIKASVAQANKGRWVDVEGKYYDMAYKDSNGKITWNEHKDINWEGLDNTRLGKIKNQAITMKNQAKINNIDYVEISSDTVIPSTIKQWFLDKGFLVRDPTGVYGK